MIQIIRILLLRHRAYIETLKFSTDGEYYTPWESMLLKMMAFRKKRYVSGPKSIKLVNVSSLSLLLSFLVTTTIFAMIGTILTQIAMRTQKFIENPNFFIPGAFLLCQELFFSFVILLMVRRLRNTTDPFSMRKELQITTCLGIFFALWVGTWFFNPPEIEFSSMGVLALSQMIGMMLPYGFLVYCICIPKYMTRNLKADTISLERVFSNQLLWEEFKVILADEYCSENGEFVERLDSINLDKLQDDLRALYVDFIGTDAMFELNIPHTIRHKLRTDYEKHQLLLEDFVKVRNEVWMGMVFFY